jgi:outer membrane protein OmpA-like peptidoglycan-associated protein
MNKLTHLLMAGTVLSSLSTAPAIAFDERELSFHLAQAAPPAEETPADRRRTQPATRQQDQGQPQPQQRPSRQDQPVSPQNAPSRPQAPPAAGAPANRSDTVPGQQRDRNQPDTAPAPRSANPAPSSRPTPAEPSNVAPRQGNRQTAPAQTPERGRTPEQRPGTSPSNATPPAGQTPAAPPPATPAAPASGATSPSIPASPSTGQQRPANSGPAVPSTSPSSAPPAGAQPSGANQNVQPRTGQGSSAPTNTPSQNAPRGGAAPNVNNTNPQQAPAGASDRGRQRPEAQRGSSQPSGSNQPAPLTRSGTPAPSSDQRPITPAAAGSGMTPQSSQGQSIRRVDELRSERRQTKEGNRTIIREPDRTIIKEGNRTIIRHDESNRFRVGAQDVRVERRGNDNVTIVVRPGGDRIVNTTDANGFLLRRSRLLADGREIVIIDNRPRAGGRTGNLFVALPPPRISIPRDRYIVEYRDTNPGVIYETLTAAPVDTVERAYSLDEIRYSAPLRDRMPRIDLNTVTFDTGSWELAPEQVDKLAPVADGIKRAIEQNPQEVFLIEGHTDAVGDENDNLSLSDRRAEAVAIALTEQFQVPTENLTTQGYGEQNLKVPTQEPEEANRRVSVRRITPLLTANR